MPIATYKDLCIDAVDPTRLGRFWADVLHLDLELLDSGDARLVGPTASSTVWVNRVPEPVTTKQRVHLDVRAASVQDVASLGATVLDSESFAWTVMKDPEGGELCVFRLREGTAPGLMEIVVDSEEPEEIATWWADMLGAQVGRDEEHHFCWLEAIPNAPFENLVFVPVPEPKTVKNRIHLDVTTPSVQTLLDAGARLLRGPDEEIHWTVLADPEGNEFCAFSAGSSSGGT